MTVSRTATVSELVDAAREACGAHDWPTAHRLLCRADAEHRLAPEDLERLAACARWCGACEAILDPLERAHARYVAADDRRGGARTAIALALAHADRRSDEMARVWFGRAAALLEGTPHAPEHGWIAWLRSRGAADGGALEAQEAAAREALAIATGVGDAGVEALARLELAHVASARGRTQEAFEQLDRATALAVGGEIGLFETGVVLCGAVWAARCRGEWGRAGQWTETIDRWCARVRVEYFPGLCRVHRSEVFRIRGRLEDAAHESAEAARLLERTIPKWVAIAHAELGEVRRRLGDLAGAMEAFRRALELGWSPQPGLALVLLAQGDAEGAHRMLERTVASALPTWLAQDRPSMHRARVTVALAVGAGEVADEALAALEAHAAEGPTDWDRALIALARGEVALARGALDAAVSSLADAKRRWAQLEAPYELAGTSALLARALDAEGDATGAELERGVARATFERIGARRTPEEIGGHRRPGERPRPAGVRDVAATFRSDGDGWVLGWGGRSARLSDLKGLRYLAALLAAPGDDVLAADLAYGPGDRGGDAGDALDWEARAAYRERIQALRREIDDAEASGSIARADAAREEMEAIGRELSAALGLGGRARKVGSAAERARQSVTKAIRTALRKLEPSLPDLARLLETTVRTGTFCRYEPDPRFSIRWEL